VTGKAGIPKGHGNLGTALTKAKTGLLHHRLGIVAINVETLAAAVVIVVVASNVNALALAAAVVTAIVAALAVLAATVGIGTVIVVSALAAAVVTMIFSGVARISYRSGRCGALRKIRSVGMVPSIAIIQFLLSSLVLRFRSRPRNLRKRMLRFSDALAIRPNAHLQKERVRAKAKAAGGVIGLLMKIIRTIHAL